MTDVIDHSALAETRIATQYKASEKFRAYIRALMAQSQELEGVFTAIAESRDIDLATGDQLDIIGEIVGVSRLVNGVIVVPFFGFEGVLLAQPFGEEGNLWVGGRFYEEGEETTGTSVLADPEYRLLIRAKIVRNHSKGTCEDIMNALTYLFDGAPSGIVDDIGGMAIDIGIGRPLTNIEYALITELDILPRPAGVRINRIINYASGAVFGFEGQPGVLGFGEEGDPSVGGIFAEDVTDGLPEYPEITPVVPVEPDFTGYFTGSEVLSSTVAYHSESGTRVTVSTGSSLNTELVLQFGVPGNTGKWLMIFDVTRVYDDANYETTILAGFGHADVTEPDTSFYAALGGIRHRPAGAADTQYRYEFNVQDADESVTAENILDSVSPNNPVHRYFAVAFDFDTGSGRFIDPFSYRDIATADITSGGTGVFGQILEGRSMAGYLKILSTRVGSSAMGSQFYVDLVASSASHGLTLPSGYTNIVPD